MPNPAKQHTKKIQERLNKLDGDCATMQNLVSNGLAHEGATMFALDILAFGAAKRAISATSALKQLIESWNMVTGRTLLRTHIDTSLRFSAAWLVDNPHDFAKKIIAGERLDKIKDRKGNQLRDAYLVECMAPSRPWLPEVYKQLSGFVHFSGAHVFASVASMDGEGSLSFQMSEYDLDYPEESWIELIDCFREATEILSNYLQGYIVTKRAAPEELEAERQKVLEANPPTKVTP
jgi:hypothetical protein